MITNVDIAWLAGLFEGEATFVVNFDGSIRINIGMTDQDVIQHVSDLFGGRPIYRATRHKNFKQMFITGAAGSQAAAWMMTLYPFLGARRREKIRECLRRWRNSHKGRIWATCHPNRRSKGLGMCSVCYQRHKRRRNGIVPRWADTKTASLL